MSARYRTAAYLSLFLLFVLGAVYNPYRALDSQVLRYYSDNLSKLEAQPYPFQDLTAKLTQAKSQENAAGILRSFAAGLNSNALHARKLIVKFLRSGADAPTGLPFAISHNGKLESASTLRVFMLDQLARVDSKAAAEIAQEIFNSSRSVEEWTIALRNYAWGKDDSRGDPYLVDVSRRLLERTEWLKQASSAYLEAFDLIPYNRDIGYAPKLVQHISASANGEIRHAAFLALDKLMLQAPLELGRTLGEIIPERHSNLRASLMARLDASREDERALIKEYLSDNTIASGEFQEFFRLYPLTSKAIGPALVTEERFESLQQLAAKDLYALSFLRELSSLPDYIRHAKGFDLAASRIERHVRAAANSGLFEQD